MTMIQKFFFSVFVLVLLSGLSACEREGTATRAGQKVDQATDRAEQKLEQAGQSLSQAAGKAEQKMEQAGQAIKRKAENTGGYLDDAAITSKIKAGILSDPQLKVAQINVITTNGTVKLSGNVDNQQGVDRAMEIARSVKDVKSIENNLVATNR